MKFEFEKAYWNPEGIPDGYDEDGDVVFRTLFTPMVQFSNGARFIHSCSFDTQEKADSFVADLSNKGAIDVVNGDWVETDPEYGSARHQKRGDYHLMNNAEKNANRATSLG
jgi:hypothetical protein